MEIISNILLSFLFISGVLSGVLSDDNELRLREELFSSYNKNNRPVLDFTDNVKLYYGIEIKNLEVFDMKAENIKFNLWITQKWNDQYLRWNKTEYNFNHINIYSRQIWVPDLELYNAGSKPKVYDTHGGLKLYSNGDILWSRPTTYSFSCPLDFLKFPFDSQECTLLFGSWKYNANFLDIIPFNDELNTNNTNNNNNNTKHNFLNISVNPNFSHNEWNIVDRYVKHENIEYLCCPGELWPNSFFTIELKRNYTKYMIVIAMTLLITIASLSLLLFPIKYYSRTFVLVFLPLSIIWLQIYISGKMPVIEYYTIMDKILLTCFLITIINALESAILYGFLYEKYEYNWLIKLNNYLGKNTNRNKNIEKETDKLYNYKFDGNISSNIDYIEEKTKYNKDLYKSLYNIVLLIDNTYKFMVSVSFVVVIGVLLS